MECHCFPACWSPDPRERPTFAEIIAVLEDIRDSSFIGTQQDEFVTLRNDWKEEIEEMFNELKEKEQVREKQKNLEIAGEFSGSSVVVRCMGELSDSSVVAQ